MRSINHSKPPDSDDNDDNDNDDNEDNVCNNGITSVEKKWGPLIIQNSFKIRSPIAPLFQEELLEMRLSDGLSAEN